MQNMKKNRKNNKSFSLYNNSQIHCQEIADRFSGALVFFFFKM